MPLRAVFLDVDGVILDPARSGLEWLRLCGDVFAEEFGGDAAAWGRANQELFADAWRVFQAASWDRREHPAAAARRLDSLMVRLMCERLGVAAPDDDRCHAIARRRDVYVAERMDAAFAGAAEAIRALAVGHELHTASGNPTYRIDGLLRGMGVRDAFGLTVGPELPGVAKYRPGFYEAIFELAGTRAEQSVVVDDHAGALADARAAGAFTVHIPPPGAEPAESRGFSAVIGSLAELPAVVATLAR